MTDNFALLGEKRHPWIDTDALKTRFFSLSAEVHPDKVHQGSETEKDRANQKYAELNAAYNCLREPRERLLHLLELEAGAKPKDVQRIPAGTMDLFVEVGQLCRDADAFLAGRDKTTSPLLKVRLFEQAQEWTEKLTALQSRINSRQQDLAGELQRLNPVWDSAPPPGSPGRAASLPLDRLEQIYRTMSYVSRWTGQIQERVLQLAF